MSEVKRLDTAMVLVELESWLTQGIVHMEKLVGDTPLDTNEAIRSQSKLKTMQMVSAKLVELKTQFTVDESAEDSQANWCGYFGCSVTQAVKNDTLGECDHDCALCGNRTEEP